jgi:hypothetical protein
MRLISHRGNIDGKIIDKENSPLYIDQAIKRNFDVEIDLWITENEFYLGHDKPEYPIKLDWMIERKDKLWIHCKNIEAIKYFNINQLDLNYFWHENDLMTLTSKGFMWVFPGKQPIKNSVAVMPEINDDNISECFGICSDYIQNYR